MQPRERVARRWAASWRVAMVAITIGSMALALRAPPAHAGLLLVGETMKPQGVAVDPRTGVVYVGDSDGNICRILSVNATGMPEVLAGGSGRCATSGDGGSAYSAEVEPGRRLAVDGSGNVYSSDGYALRRISQATGRIAAWAGRAEWHCLEFSYGGPHPSVGAVAAEVGMYTSGVATDPVSGHLYVLDACARAIWEIDESGVVVARYGGFGTERSAYASSLAFDPEGNLYFSEGLYGQQIVKMDRRGAFTTIAGNGGTSNSGDGGPATRAELHGVAGLAVDSRGNLYFATTDSYIRVVTPEGTLYPIAGRSWLESVPSPPYPGGPVEQGKFAGIDDLAIDAEDNLYVSDWLDSTLLTLQRPIEPRSTVGWILHERVPRDADGERRRRLDAHAAPARPLRLRQSRAPGQRARPQRRDDDAQL